MAQNFQDIPATQTVVSSRQPLLDRDAAAASNFSGSAFPTLNLLVGMRCHRTDLNKVYALKDLTPTWIEVEDIGGTSGLTPRATALATQRAFSVTGDAATAAPVNFDGTGNVALNVTLATQAGLTPGSYSKVTVNAKGLVTGAVALAAADLPADLTPSTVRLSSGTAVTLASTAHAFQIGADGAGNLVMDQNDIQARNNGAASALGINALGGNVTLGNSASTVTLAGPMVLNQPVNSFVQSEFDPITFAASITPPLSGSNFKTIVSTGAFTLNAPAAGFYTMVIRITNSTGAGAITLAGFTRVIGDAFNTTVGQVFQVIITRTGTNSLATVVAL